MSTSTVKEAVEVGVPVHTAYNQWTQFEHFPHFMEGVEEVRQLDDRHNRWITSIGGVRREFDTEIVDQSPDECLTRRAAGAEVSGPRTPERHSDALTGKVDTHSGDVGASQLVVDIGAWIFGRHVVIPAGLVIGVDTAEERIYVDRTKE
jgi:hypothetical protein